MLRHGQEIRIESLENDPQRVSVADVVRLFRHETDDLDLLSRVMEVF
ncbi:MAG: hypothetical protein WB992_12055 [Bryobacteraceae bacterium]